MNDDGSSDIVIDCEGFEWVTGWALGFGNHAWISGPSDARQAMRERVAAMTSRLTS